MKFRRGFKIEEGEKVLVVEDVIIIGGFVREIIEIVEEYRGEIVVVVGIVDRSGGKVEFGYFLKIFFIFEIEIYEFEECLFCKEGIFIVKFGSRKSK